MKMIRWIPVVTPLTLACFLASGCSSRVLLSQPFSQHTRLRERVIVTLHSGPTLSGHILSMTEEGCVLSSPEVPLDLVRLQSLPIRADDTPVTLYLTDGSRMSGKIVRVQDSQVVIHAMTWSGYRDRIVERNSITTVALMGRNEREVQVTLDWAQVRSMQAVRASDEKTTALVIYSVVLFLVGIGIIYIRGPKS
jgi:sRNA-binding regulator protein Hfq